MGISQGATLPALDEHGSEDQFEGYNAKPVGAGVVLSKGRWERMVEAAGASLGYNEMQIEEVGG